MLTKKHVARTNNPQPRATLAIARLSSCDHQPIQPCYAVLILLSEPQQTEVLCSVQFAPVQQLTLEFGRLWETLSRDPALAACQLVQFYNIGISGITPRPAKVSCNVIDRNEAQIERHHTCQRCPCCSLLAITIFYCCQFSVNH